MQQLQNFEDYINKYLNIDKEDWIPIYEELEDNNVDDLKSDIFGYSALIPNDNKFINEYLKDYEWGFSTNTFGKSYYEKVYSSNTEKEKLSFIAGDKKDRFEYIVAYRTFNEKYSTEVEINPKLIWYYNLVKRDNKYIDPITDDVKIKIEEKKILVLKSYLKDYLCASNKCCVICFDHRRFFKTESKLKHSTQTFSQQNYNIILSKNCYDYSEYNGLSSILGKVIIRPYSKPKHRDYVYFTEVKKYENYIIGVDSETGDDIEFSCNEDDLANYFGKNPNAPHFLTPVYFERRVLDKYTNNPSNYTVGDGTLMFLDEWSLPFTINDDNKVVVWLGDLGRIPHSEQKYWKLHNIKPQGGMEKKFFQRQMMSQFTDSITLEKKLFELKKDLNKLFVKKYGDEIFSELNETDQQIESAFSIPTNGSVTTYQTFLIQLCKITIESINNDLIETMVPKEKLIDKDNKSFGSRLKLKIFLDKLNIKGAEKLDNVLKIIYNSRNKLAGHKGSMQEYNKVWDREKNYKPDFISDSKILLTTLNNSLNNIIEEIS
jgi:hypothetical protein